MQKRSQELKIVEANSFRNIKKLKKNEILLSPATPLLLDDSCRPYENLGNWPEWWKALQGNEGSLKRCSGTSDYISTGITIPLWANLMLRPSIDGKNWQAKFDLANNMGDWGIEGFGFSQTGECPVSKARKMSEANYIKVINPWLIKTPPGWSSLFLPPLWDPNPNYTMLPAVVNTDYYHTANMVMSILTDEPFELEIGRPMWHVIPFQRNAQWKITWGGESIYPLLRWRGFGGAFFPKNQKSKYKKLQREIDASLQDDGIGFTHRLKRGRWGK